MKKTVILTAGIILASSLAFGVKASAAEYNTNGSIDFTADTTITPPVDPIDPEKPVDPEGPKEPGTAGPLSIDFASHFKFGQQKISTQDQIYNAHLQEFNQEPEAPLQPTTAGPNYVQVTDKRGSGAGWTLSCIQVAQFATTDGDILEGAALSIHNGTTTSTANENLTPMIETTHTFTPETKAALVTAAKDQGMGTWVYKFGANLAEAAEAVQLFVPGSATQYEKEYTTTLNWSLESTVENGPEEG